MVSLTAREIVNIVVEAQDDERILTLERQVATLANQMEVVTKQYIEQGKQLTHLLEQNANPYNVVSLKP